MHWSVSGFLINDSRVASQDTRWMHEVDSKGEDHLMSDKAGNSSENTQHSILPPTKKTRVIFGVLGRLFGVHFVLSNERNSPSNSNHASNYRKVINQKRMPAYVFRTKNNARRHIRTYSSHKRRCWVASHNRPAAHCILQCKPNTIITLISNARTHTHTHTHTPVPAVYNT